VQIRRLHPADVPAVAAVCRASVAGTEGDPYSAEQVAAWLRGMTDERIATSVATTQMVGALTYSGELAGFANLVVRGDGDGELDLLYVHPSAAGRGVARLLVAEVERMATAAGLASVVVDASLLAAPVLEHLGYAVERRYEKAAGGATFPNTWLRKRLTVPAPRS
jgi:putative acetyltransferase